MVLALNTNVSCTSNCLTISDACFRVMSALGVASAPGSVLLDRDAARETSELHLCGHVNNTSRGSLYPLFSFSLLGVCPMLER